MKLLLKIFPFLLLGLTLIALIVSGFFVFLSYQSLPKYSNNLYSSEISSKISINTDLYAVPHISANSNNEVFFGLGYAHAQERLWQMNYLKRLSQGRLSEINGPSTVILDSFMKTLDLQSLSKKIYQNLSPNSKDILLFYSKGINFRLNEIQTEGLGRGSPEFFFQSPEVTPWTPIDSLTILKLIEFISSDKALMEITQTSLLLSKTDEQKLNHLIENVSLFRSKLNSVSSKLREQTTSKKSKANLNFNTVSFSPVNGGFYSNIFAADSSRSASKKSLLSANLFLPLSSPSLWMLAHLNLSETPVVGVTIPGLPLIFSGKNNNLAWGSSFSFIDDQDLYFEKINPLNNQEYLSPSGYKKFNIKKKLIKVKNSPTISYSVKQTENRVIIPHSLYGMQSLVPEGFSISLAWTGFRENDTTIETLLNIMTFKKIADFKNNISQRNSFNLVFVVADETKIDSFFIGTPPKRFSNSETKGLIITPGWKAKNQWKYEPEAKGNIVTLSKKNGFILNTNNRLNEKVFQHHLSYNWGDEQRLLRATKMIDSREFHTSESFKELQNDIVSEPARTLLPLMGKDLWFQYDNNDSNDINMIKSRSLELLTNWNGNMDINSPEPLIYYNWIKTFKEMLVEDELGFQYFPIDIITPLFLEKVLRNYQDAGYWCDIKHSEKTETCAELSKKSFNKSLRKLKDKYGPDVDSWKWGRERRIKHSAYSVDGIFIPSFLREISNEMPGSIHTLNSTTLINSFEESEAKGSSFKMIIDFSSPNKNMFILPSGQSGHLISRHYDDQTSLWKDGEYIFLSGDKKTILGGSKGETIITPYLPK